LFPLSPDPVAIRQHWEDWLHFYSLVAMTFTRQPNGTTDIDVVVVREGKNLKGWVLGLVVGTIGRRVLEKAFENSVKAIEARKGAARAAGAS
jgi:hypothetical protein